MHSPSSASSAMPALLAPVNVRGDFPLRVFFGHHKCATGWIDGILMEVCFHMGINFRIVHLPVHFQREGSLDQFVRQRRVDFLAYTNADRDYVADLPFYRGFHVVRDPRDVLVSAYFSHLYSHETKHWPELEAHRARLKTLSKEEGLFCEMEFSSKEFDEMYRWDYHQAHVLELKMEELTAAPTEGFLRIARFLEIVDPADPQGLPKLFQTVNLRMNRLNQKGRRFMPGKIPMFPVPRRRLQALPAEKLTDIIQGKNFRKMSGGRRQGQENVQSHYRKGTPGDWKNHFDEAHIRLFKETYNNLLIKLGYEDDSDW